MYAGPSDETRVDAGRPETWTGLSAGDHDLLVRYLGKLGVEPDELHTHVPVGMPDDLAEDQLEGVSKRLYSQLWPRRIDAVLRFGDKWWLVECKVNAAHYVLGQCLCYAMWWFRECQPLELDRIVVVTNVCDTGVAMVLSACGIDVVELMSTGAG
jgi:hypothetical protein